MSNAIHPSLTITAQDALDIIVDLMDRGIDDLDDLTSILDGLDDEYVLGNDTVLWSQVRDVVIAYYVDATK